MINLIFGYVEILMCYGSMELFNGLMIGNIWILQIGSYDVMGKSWKSN